MSKRGLMNLLQLYAEGRITLTEVFLLACMLASEAEKEEIMDFMARCPEDILRSMKESLSQYIGDDPSIWPRTMIAGTYSHGSHSDEWEVAQQAKQQAFQKGVAILKSHFNKAADRSGLA